MAHADYHCCAVCDAALDYAGWDASTKERICEDCLLKLQDMGLGIVTVGQLITWIENTPKEVVQDKLREMGFHFCYYPNDVDDAVLAKEIEFDADRRPQARGV